MVVVRVGKAECKSNVSRMAQGGWWRWLALCWALALFGCGSGESVSVREASSGAHVTAPVVRKEGTAQSGPGYGFVYRFAKISNGAYFYTGHEGERDLVLENYPDFRYEGIAYLKNTQGASTPVYRFANLLNGGYFYTASEAERDEVMRTRLDMRYEGTTFSVAQPSTDGAVPIYRLANLGNGAYLYTALAAERDFAVGTGQWRAEGTAFYALSPSTVLPFVVSGFSGDLYAPTPGDGGGSSGGSGGADGGADGGAGGAGSEGAIRYADVRLYDSAGKLLGTAVSDFKGLVTLRANGVVGPFRIEYVGNDKAEYFDEGIALSTQSETNAWVKFGPGEKISGWVLDLKKSVVVSALTNAAAEEIARSAITPVTAAMVRSANEKVRTTFNSLFTGSGIAVEDITRAPALAFNLESLNQFGNDAPGQYAQMLSSLAKSARQFNPTLPNPAREMTKQLARDLSDGVIDAKDNTGAPVAPTTQRAYDFVQLPQVVVRQTAGRLEAQQVGSGTVDVSASAAVVPCESGGGTCYPWGTTVNLSAQPAQGWLFQGWSGACTGTGACQVTMSGDKAVTATFVTVQPTQFNLTVNVVGPGSVSSTPAGISCGTGCVKAFDSGQVITLTPVGGAGAAFAGWDGACTGTGPCTVTMDAAKRVGAYFGQAVVALTVSKQGAGSGTVSSTPAGIACGTGCTKTMALGSLVTLTATAAPGSTFGGWDGACTGTGACTVTMDAAKNVIAFFGITTYPLTVTKAGLGSGTVSSTPVGINCGADCTEPYAAGTAVSLLATPASGSSFSGWSGACTGTGACVVSMDAAKTVTASYALAPTTFTLTVLKAGAGVGTVTALAGGITCGSDCSEPYPAGRTVTLTASAGVGSVFAGWSGACSGAGACTLTMDAAKSLTATFETPQSTTQTLNVSKNGTGSGTVSSTPAGISCGTDCTEGYAFNTLVTLSASPASGSTFSGWSGACSGPGNCSVRMDAAKDVIATFAGSTGGPPSGGTFSLTVAKSGPGSGASTITGLGINCGSDCAESYPTGTFTGPFSFTTAPGTVLLNWGGDCAGGSYCILTMDSNKTLQPQFGAGYTLTMSETGSSSQGNISPNPGAPEISCGSSHCRGYAPGTFVSIGSSWSLGTVFGAWGGACSFVTDPFANCLLTMDSDKFVTKNYLPYPTGPATLNVSVIGSGRIDDYSPVFGQRWTIYCQSDGSGCSWSYPTNDTITLNANAPVIWGGACTGTASTCTLTMGGPRNVTATFPP